MKKKQEFIMCEGSNQLYKIEYREPGEYSKVTDKKDLQGQWSNVVTRNQPLE